MHLEVQMRVGRERIAGVADEADHVTAVNGAVVAAERRVPGEMRVVEVVAGVVDEPQPPPADAVPTDREDRPVGDGDHRRAELGEEVVPVMPAAGDV